MMHFRFVLFSVVMLALCCFNSTSAQDSLPTNHGYFIFKQKTSFIFEVSVYNHLSIYRPSGSEYKTGVLLGRIELEKWQKGNQSMVFGVHSLVSFDTASHITRSVIGWTFGKRRTFILSKKHALETGLGLVGNYYLNSYFQSGLQPKQKSWEETHNGNVGFGPYADLHWIIKTKIPNGPSVFGIGLNYAPTFLSTRQWFLYQHSLMVGFKVIL